ncbi:putative mitochondrial 2-oxoglutarate/malate carrier protein [Ascosphaera acerosa]|nr:putative mitochondrial 2-oxoglutarate/malate carrier protein [Ascosphaera acerosa]
MASVPSPPGPLPPLSPTTPPPDPFQHALLKPAIPFINGGIAGMTATAVIQPVDMIKVRLQLAGEGVKSGPKPSALAVTRAIVSSGRLLDLYTGLSAGLLRQAVYTTARLGIFETLMTRLKHNAEERGAKSVTFYERAVAGLAAGGLAATVGNPADLALIRMQADGLKPVEQRNHYRSVIDALARITRSEGVLSLWAGCTPTVIRAMALNFGQLAFFAESKAQLAAHSSLSPSSQTFAASAIAGFFASFFSLPFDFIKTRLQKQVRDAATGKLQYAGVWDCARTVVRNEGWLRFYRGFGTYYVRIAPHAMVTLIVVDYLNLLTK